MQGADPQCLRFGAEPPEKPHQCNQTAARLSNTGRFLPLHVTNWSTSLPCWRTV